MRLWDEGVGGGVLRVVLGFDKSQEGGYTSNH